MATSPDPASRSLLHRVVIGTRTTGVERACFALLGVFLVVGALANDWGVFYPDNKPEIYLAPDRTFAKALSTWQPSPKQAGLPSFDTGVAPVAAVSWALRETGLEPWLVVRVWRATLLVLAALGAVRLLDHLSSARPHAAARVAVAAVYSVNPYLVVQGTTTAVLLPYALLPFLLVALDRAIAEPRRWRWPALAALVFFAMSGINAGVIPLMLVALCVPALVAHRRLALRTAWATMVGGLARTAVLAGGVSLYWLIPSALAAATGTAVAGATESLGSIADTTSFSESVRLTGMWTLYGSTGERLFSPQYASYLTNPFVVLASFVLPLAAVAGAIVSRGRTRLLAVVLLALGLPLMAGVFPPADRTPIGTALGWSFENLPGFIAFRTTNKAAPVVALALALLVAHATAWCAVQLRSKRAIAQSLAAALAVLVLATSSYPSWSGNLYRQELDPPDHWRQLGADLDAGDRRTRVLVLPGGAGGNYRWSMRSPDDIFNSVMDRDVLARSTVFPPHNGAANLVAHLDTAVAEQALVPGSMSVLARMLGVGEVVARNDYRWEEVGAARPFVVVNNLRADEGLIERDAYGPRGVYTQRPLGEDEEPTDLDVAERAMPALLRFGVEDPLPMVRTSPAAGSVLLVGDGAALPQLIETGLLDGLATVRYAGDLEPDDALTMLEHGASVVLTDTNRRRHGGTNRVRNVWSETLSASEPFDPERGPSLTLWPEYPDRQTTVRLAGAREVRASLPPLGTAPGGKPSFAFDGDEASRWVTGRFGTGKGQWIEIIFDAPIELAEFDLLPFGDETMRMTEIQVHADHATERFGLDGTSRVRVALPPGVTERLRIEIIEVAGNATRGVGFREIEIPGVAVQEVPLLPQDLDRLAANREVAEAFEDVPLHIVLQRLKGLPFDTADDEERVLHRDLSLPVERAFTFSATVSSSRSIPHDAFQDLFIGFEDGAALDSSLCFEVAHLGDAPVRARVIGDFWSLLRGTGVQLELCDDEARLTVAAGSTALRSAPGWILDDVHLHSAGDKEPTQAVPAPPPQVHRSEPTALTLDIAAAEAPYYLTTGRGWDPGWQATMDGSSLGPPAVLDGYAAGWLIEDLAPHRIEITYGPQRWLLPSFAASLLALGVCAWLALRRSAAP